MIVMHRIIWVVGFGINLWGILFSQDNMIVECSMPRDTLDIDLEIVFSP